MEIIEKNKNNSGYDTFDIVTNGGRFQISYEANLDLYWKYICDNDSKDIKAFKITKENYYIYEAIDNLWTAVKDNMPYYNYPYETEERYNVKPNIGKTSLYNGHEIRWYSDDFAHLDSASNFAIRKFDDYYMIIFTKSYAEPSSGYFYRTYAVRINSSGSRYEPYHIPFMAMYQKLKEYDPDYHQIHIEEYLYEEECKKRVKTK